MADLVEIGIEVRTGKVTSATKEINALGESVKSAERSASIFVQTLERQEKQLVRASTHNKKFTDTAQRMYNNLLNVNKEIKSASASAQVFEKQILKDELAIQKNNAALAKMKGQYDLTFNAQQKLLQYKKLLRTAVDQEKMSVQEAAKEMKRYRAAMVEMGASQMAATKSSNRLGVATQQAGYQVSDFIVQVQAGTNPFTAFSMQASQLVGILPLVASRLGLTTAAAIGLSAALGVAIPIVGAIGAALLVTSRNSKDAEDSFEGLNNAIESYIDLTRTIQDGGGLGEEFGYLAEQVDRVLNRLREIEAIKIDQSLKDLLGGEIVTAQVFSRPEGGFVEKFDPSQLRQAQQILGLEGLTTAPDVAAAEEYLNLVREIQQAEDLDGRIAATEKLAGFINENVDKTKLEAEQLGQIQKLEETLLNLLEMRATQTGVINDKTREGQEELNELLEAGRKATIDRNRQSMLTILGLEQEVALAEKALEYGQDSVEFVREKARQEALALNLTSKATQEYLDLQLKLFELDQGQAAQEAADKRAAAIDRLTTKYTKLADAQMNGELGAKEATRRAREELELINAAKAAGIKLTSNEYLQLVQSLRTFQAQRKAAEDNLEITKLQDQALDAIAKAENKVFENEIKLKRAKGDNLTADRLAVQLAGDRAYQAIMAKANTEEEAKALKQSAEEARTVARLAQELANETRNAKDEAKELEDALKEAARAMDALVTVGDNIDKAFVKAQARVKALKEGVDAANAASIAGQEFDLKKAFEEAKEAATGPDGVIAATKEYNKNLATLKQTAEALAEGNALEESAKASKKAMDEAAKAAEKLEKKIKDIKDAADPFREYNEELELLNKLLAKGRIEQEEYNHAVDQLNEGLGSSIKIIGDVEQAFSDWLSRGLDDFKGFVKSIKDMFVKLLADLAAQAIRNRILIPITTGFAAGFGSTAAATTMEGMKAGTMGSTLAGYGAAIGTGLSNFGSAALHTITGGTMGSVAAGSTMASIGAVAPYILAAVAVIGLFTSKTKKLDEGLRVTVNGMDTLVESFELLQKSRLFGLLKGRKFTEYEEVVDSPIVEAVATIQDSVLKAANSLGIASDAFDDFSYQFQVSLKGLTEEEKIQKVNEELNKMGDAFASLSGHFSNMNDLLAVAQQRYDLETRLLQLQGNNTALLARQRERERAATHELNQGVLDQIYVLEDAQIAFNNLAASIQTRKDQITRSFNEIMETIQGKIQDASEAASKSASILGMLQGASGRVGMTREAGLDYLRGLRGVSRIEDDKALGEALQAIGEPSEDLYGSFTDYQREFADQANIIRELEEKAGVQVSNDEKMLDQLRLEAEAAEDRYETQIGYLDQQLQDAQDQLNALLGINEGILGVQDALKGFADAVNKALAQAAEAAKAAAEAKAVADAGGGGSVLGKYGTGTQYKGYDHAELKGAQELLDAANIAGVDTSGKTGAQIQQDISNATGLAIGLDSGTRDDQFALGGYHSGGVRLVGERGPELEATGPSRVYSANQTKRLMQNPDLVEAVKAMKQEITELRNEQRQLGINNNKYTKRTYDLYRQWDTEGLPAERT